MTSNQTVDKLLKKVSFDKLINQNVTLFPEYKWDIKEIAILRRIIAMDFKQDQDKKKRYEIFVSNDPERDKKYYEYHDIWLNTSFRNQEDHSEFYTFLDETLLDILNYSVNAVDIEKWGLETVLACLIHNVDNAFSLGEEFIQSALTMV